MRTKELFAFMEERHAIYERKSQGGRPWTTDRILQRYRFCNVYRELDTQTKWFADNWRDPNFKDDDLWFASLVFRVTNWHETAAEIGYPVPFDAKHFVATLHSRKLRKLKNYNSAYMITTHGALIDKAEYLASYLQRVWEKRADLRYMEGLPLYAFHDELMGCFGVGSFIAAQVVADCKYAGKMLRAPDWWTFAASGPGSRRGLNRVMGLPPKHPTEEQAWRVNLKILMELIAKMIKDAEMPKLHAQDLQNCLCEFDKYERVRLGEGRPKSRYKGEAE